MFFWKRNIPSRWKTFASRANWTDAWQLVLKCFSCLKIPKIYLMHTIEGKIILNVDELNLSTLLNRKDWWILNSKKFLKRLKSPWFPQFDYLESIDYCYSNCKRKVIISSSNYMTTFIHSLLFCLFRCIVPEDTFSTGMSLMKLYRGQFFSS